MNFSQFAGMNWNRQENILIKALRVVVVIWIGGMLLVAAIGKFLDNRHFAEYWRNGSFFPRGVCSRLDFSRPSLSWYWRSGCSPPPRLTAVAFHLAYSAATLVTVLRGIRLPDCGCFGIFFPHPLDWTMVAEDLLLAGVCFLLYPSAKPPRK